MAKTSAAAPTTNLAGQANTGINAGQSALNAQHLTSSLPTMPVLPALPELVQSAAQDAKNAKELLEDTLVLEEAPKVAETDTLGDVVLAQASVPAAAAATEAASTTVAVASAAVPAATATGFAGMSGLGLLGAVAGAVGVAAVVSNSGSDSPVVPAVPAEPAVPAVPAEPAVPAVPAVPLFSVTEVAGVVSFSGAAKGDITVSVVDWVVTFSRGGSTATTTVESLGDKSINIAAGQTLVMTGKAMALASVEGVKIIGAGAFKINATDDGTDTTTDLEFVLNVDLTGAQSSLTFDMTDDNQDRITLKAGSSIDLAGGNLIVSDGTLDAKLVAAGSFSVEGDVILNSGLVLTVTQLKSVTGKLSTSGEGALEIVVSTVEEAQELAGLLASRAPEGEGVTVPTVTFSVLAEAAVIDAVKAGLNDQLDAIGNAVGQTIDASAIVSVVYILTIEAAIALETSDLPVNYVIDTTALNFEDADSVESAKDQVVQIEGILANAKAPVPAIADIVTFTLADSLDVLGSDDSAAVIALARSIALNDSTTTAASLVALNGKTSVTIDATSVTLLTGKAADIAAAINSDGISRATGVNVTLTDTPESLVALETIRNSTEGTVTLKTFTLVEALALVTSISALPAAKTYYIEEGSVELGSVTVAELIDIGARFEFLENDAVNEVTVDAITATFTIEDSAVNLLAEGVASVIDGATSVIVIDNIAGALTVANVIDLRALTTDDSWTYSITDSIASFTNQSTNVQEGATSITVNLSETKDTFVVGTIKDYTENLTIIGGGGSDTYVVDIDDAGNYDAGFTIGDFTAGPREARTETDNGDLVNIIATEGADFFKYTSTLSSINGSSLILQDSNSIGPYQNSSEDGGLLEDTVIFALTEVATDGSKEGLITALGGIANTKGKTDEFSLLFINYLEGIEGGAQVWSFIDSNDGKVEEGELALLATLSNVAADSLDYSNFIALPSDYMKNSFLA